MAFSPIAECFGSKDKYFCGVVTTDGAGSPEKYLSGVFAYHRRFLLLGYTYCFHILVGVVFVQSVSCEYARENGGACLAYALDGKDGIACIDLDGCMQENGDFSETAQQAFNAASGSYARNRSAERACTFSARRRARTCARSAQTRHRPNASRICDERIIPRQ